MNHAQFWGGGGAAPYAIDQSLRFNSADSYTFRRTPSSNSTSQKKFTVSAWVKRGVLATGTTGGSGRQGIFYTGLANGAGNMFGLEWNNDGLACIFDGGGVYWPKTVAKFRDPSAWYHIVAAVDTAQATTADRFKLYVNGVEQTVTGNLPTLNFLVTNGTTSIHSAGENAGTRSNEYLAELYYINDQQLTPGDFGELNTDGVWVPKEYAGTFTGTNSCYLKFDPSATNGIGHDHSGNGNNFTPSASFNTSGTGTDVFSDTPTTNWCTLNPLNRTNSATAPTDGNLTSPANAGVWRRIGATIQLPTTGKFYFEYTCDSYSSFATFNIGVFSGNIDTANNSPGFTSTEWVYDAQNGYAINNNASISTGFTTATTGDILQLAYDADTGKIWFGKNNTWQGASSPDPATGTSATYSGVYNVTPLIIQNWATQTVNFGQRAFAYTPPTGFEALNTANLPAPDIANGSDYFNTVTYTGNGSTQAITTVGFQPDLVWIKKRNATANHGVHDSARVIGGLEAVLYTNSTAAENTGGAYISSFDSSGFTLNANTSGNNLNDTFAAWCWKEGATPGFDIVTYTGDGTTSSSRLIDHNLGVTPDLIITKKRSSGTTDYGWSTWHKDLGGNYGMWLNLTNSRNASMWAGYTNFSSTKFTPPDLNYGNENTQTYVNYLWAEVPGFSRIGSYPGNGNADGPFVYCGFRPKYVMVKRSDASGYDWEIFDSARATYNVIGPRLWANLDTNENSNDRIDFLSNGFKLRNSGGQVNGGTIVFAAFAEHPFGGSGVSPATAR